MIIIYIIAGIILLFLLLGLAISNDMNYEKSVHINANAKQIWPSVSSHEGMDKWSPWNERDPDMEKTLTGDDGTVGAKQCWKSPVKNVGEGCQTISKIVKPTLVETKLEFIKPFKSFADAYIKLEEEDNSTTVTWGFKSKMPYPMNIMKLFMNFKKAMDKDFGSGLTKLKSICEK